MLLNTGAVSNACRIDRIEIVVHNLKILIVKHTILNLCSLSSPLHCLQSAAVHTEGKACPGITTLQGLENFRRQLQHGLACGEAAITLQGKGKASDDGQVQGCLTRFLRDNGSILLQAVASKTAQVPRAEKNGRRFPTTNRFSVKQSWYWYELRNYLTEFIFIINL